MTCDTEYFNTLLASIVDLCQLDKKAEPRNVLVIFSEPGGWKAWKGEGAAGKHRDADSLFLFKLGC